VIAATLRQRSRPAAPRALAVNAVIQRRIAEVAVGSQFRTDPAADPIGGGSRYLFAAPHGDRTLLGTWYAPEGLAGSTPESGVGSLVREFNEVCPGLALSLNDVAGYQWGWLPLKGANEPGSPTALAERPRVVEYGEAQARHLISVEGVKYTTARRVAEKVVDWVFQDLNRANPQCRTAEVPLDGIGADGTPALDQAPEAEVRRAVQEEMAVKLSDIVFRRSTLGTTGRLNRARLAEVARMASMELGWDTMRQQAEVEDVMQTGGFAPAEEPVA
jgi:glycerol-3-phosphate dehydrogenase